MLVALRGVIPARGGGGGGGGWGGGGLGVMPARDANVSSSRAGRTAARTLDWPRKRKSVRRGSSGLASTVEGGGGGVAY